MKTLKENFEITLRENSSLIRQNADLRVENENLRKALDECPWPEDIFQSTVEEAGKAMREALGDLKTAACSGALMRHAWAIAKRRLSEI